MDVVFFTQNPQKSQNLLGCIFFTQNPQKSQILLDAKFASHRDSNNSPYSACLKKASHRDSQNSACNNNITSP